jgi:chemotaxis protein CheZ
VITEREIVDQLTVSVSDRVSGTIRETLSSIIQDEISKALTRALVEGQFYRSLNAEVIDSIETVYSEIRAVKRIISAESSDESINLISESDSILDGIIKSTEKATLTILDYLEEIQSDIKEIHGLLDGGNIPSCREKLNGMERAVIQIMTELSFQDLTGQQIKRVVQSLKKIEEISFDTYVTSEILKKSKEQAPEKNIEEIRQKTREIVEGAKTKKGKFDQDGVDSLLEELGL